MSEINITPLTDIFLVLLIIFMVSSAAMIDSGAKISLPEVDSTTAQPREITVTVTSAEEIYVNSQPTSMDQIEDVLRGLIASKPDAPVVLEGDRQVLFGEAVKILSIAQRAGASQVAIAAQRSKSEN
ncbi:MAG TPA: biopolymer transporter ExbD [Candidatus Dormibacteraeota bacterium]|nr:biopolymer transporter ExbD [Candidatus Dormibacteraeota bacterium]